VHLHRKGPLVPAAEYVGPSDDLILEQAYLVARGVRPLAIIGNCGDDPGELQEVATRLKILAGGTAIHYVVPALREGRMTYGYACHAWAIDLLRWALSDECPENQRHRIIGLLLAYSPQEIQRFDEQGCGEAFISWLPPPASSSQPSCISDNLETRAPGVL